MRRFFAVCGLALARPLSYGKSLQKTAGNNLRPGERRRDLPQLPAELQHRVDALVKCFEVYQTPQLTPQQMHEEYCSHFRPEAASAAWEELEPRALARLLAEELRQEAVEGFVDVGSGLGKLVVLAAAITPATCWGIELSPVRAAEARRAWAQLQSEADAALPWTRRVRLLQGSCLKDLPAEALEASHFLFTMRRVGKLPRGTRQVSERFLDLLQQCAAKERVLLSVGKRLEPRDGLEHVDACFLRAEWSDEEDVLIHRYILSR
ncbi:unnamed protein product [Effrenium voratum]|nr:unnamed protein product [Effrenium voratum]